jgi:3-hydroxyacyl-CoA dehydrogenase
VSNLQKLTVLGGGVLGGQIAWHSAFMGKDVVVYDVGAEAIARCQGAHKHYADIYRADLGANDADLSETEARLSYTTDLKAAVAQADFVIEAVPEIVEVKNAVYSEMADLLPEHTLVATNSSTMLPRAFADITGRPDRYCALHFANLIWLMNMAEVMAHPTTSDETLTEVTEFAIEIGMVPIAVRKEQPAYVMNTLNGALAYAAQSLVTNGVSTPEDVDRVYMKMNPGAPAGPFGMLDIVGMRTVYNIFRSPWSQQNGDPRQMKANAEYIKTNFLDSGRLGLETGSGYYNYPDPEFQQPGFLDVPDVSNVADFVASVSPGEGWAQEQEK